VGEPPDQPRLVSHETANPGWPGSVEDPRPSGCFAKRSGGGSIELLGRPKDGLVGAIQSCEQVSESKDGRADDVLWIRPGPTNVVY